MELVDLTCEWPNSQLDHPLVASLCRLVVVYLVASYVVRHGRKSVASHSENVLSRSNFCQVTQLIPGGRAQVVGRPLIGRKASQVSRRSVASVSRRSGHGLSSRARVYAGRLTNGVEVVMRSQVTLITWPIIQIFCLLACQSLPEIYVKASLRSDEKSLMTAHVSKKFRIFNSLIGPKLVAIRCKPSIKASFDPNKSQFRLSIFKSKHLHWIHKQFGV